MDLTTSWNIGTTYLKHLRKGLMEALSLGMAPLVL
jgi:hypothetical protein